MSHRARCGGALVAVCLATAACVLEAAEPSPGASGCIPSTTTGTAPPPATTGVHYPARISGPKILDQDGRVYLMRTFSSWAMAQQLSNAEITTALQGIAANGFNAVTVWVGGGYDLGSGWNRYTNHKGDRFWTGTPWASGLGPGWSSVDWILRETARLGLAANLSFSGGWDTTGAGDDWESVTDANMYAAGVAIANRYRAYPHIVWHIMFDEPSSPAATRGRRMDALFHGINDTEGQSTRPVRWAEPNNGASTFDQLINGGSQFSYVNLTLNGWYDYDDDSTVIAEGGCAEAKMPVGDVEPPYDGAGHYGGDQGQQLRERSYATFLEGGVYINYGQEDWWPFGAQGLYSEGLDWGDVPSHSHTIQQRYVWSLLDQYVADVTWGPTSRFVTTGEGSGDTKAAVGNSNTAAIAYFPTSRSVVVDTSVIAGSSPVRLRWYDPTTGSYTTIAASEAQSASRAVTVPNAHADGTRDWVLVVDTPSWPPRTAESGGDAQPVRGRLTPGRLRAMPPRGAGGDQEPG